MLDHAGAATINFNPVTANTITKALQGIADKEGFTLDPDTADGIAQAASGDLRNAVQSLQMLLLQQQPAAVQQGRKGKVRGAGGGRLLMGCDMQTAGCAVAGPPHGTTHTEGFWHTCTCHACCICPLSGAHVLGDNPLL